MNRCFVIDNVRLSMFINDYQVGNTIELLSTF